MSRFIEPAEVRGFSGRIFDCRYALTDPNAGRAAYDAGHIPGALHLDLGADLSGPVETHGGRHPLPAPGDFAATLARSGVDRATPVLLYDDSKGLFAARAWWMLDALGYGPVRLLRGGFAGWLAQGGKPGTSVPTFTACPVPAVAEGWPASCSREELAGRQARGAVLVDAREAPRYRGEVEPIDPVAGHIPGARNLPWSDLAGDAGLVDADRQRSRWGDLLQADELVVYCGSGVSACVNLLSLQELGYEAATLYPGSWSDWCSYLEPDGP